MSLAAQPTSLFDAWFRAELLKPAFQIQSSVRQEQKIGPPAPRATMPPLLMYQLLTIAPRTQLGVPQCQISMCLLTGAA